MTTKPILLVEDNPDDEALTLRALHKANITHKIIVAHDGAEALALLDDPQSLGIPQLVLLDLKLPKIDGLEVLRHIRSREATRLVPVVILTSSNEERDVIDGYKLGANSYVCKPVDFSEFSDAVGRLGSYWLAVNEPIPNNHP